MGAYNKFRGEYCCQNAYLLTDILRQEWGFDGFCTSDWLWGVRDTAKAVESGMDIEMPWAKLYGKKLVRAVEEGRVSAEAVDRAAENILLKVCEFASAPDPQAYDQSLVACQEHLDLALETAEKSMVLLENARQTLPFSGSEIKTLAVVGRLAAIENGAMKPLATWTLLIAVFLASEMALLNTSAAEDNPGLEALRAGTNFISSPVFSADADEDVLKAFQGLRVADVCDGMDAVGLHNRGLMDPAIHPLWRDPSNYTHRFVGIAVTARYVPTQEPAAGRRSVEEYDQWAGDWYGTRSSEPFVPLLRSGTALVIEDAAGADVGSIGSNNIMAWRLRGCGTAFP